MKPVLLSRSHLPIGLGTLALSLAFAVHDASAQSIWTGASSSDYNTAGNWSTGAVPGGADDVLIDSSTPNLTVIPSGNWVRTGAGITTLTGTADVILNQGSARFINNGTFNMEGGTFTQVGEYFIVGEGANGIGHLNHSGGTIDSSHSRGWQLSNNSISQSGTTYTLSGSGVLNVTSLATNTDGNLRNVWFGKGGEGYTGGNAGAPGDVFTVTGGTATFARNTAGQSSEVRFSRNASMQISGGSVSFANYTRFVVGHEASNTTNTRISMTGGTLTITGSTPVHIGAQDDGTFDLSGGTFSTDGFLFLGGAGGTEDGIGTFNMTGGLLIADLILAQNEGSSFNFDMGTIRLEGDQTNILNETWFLTADTTTATFDSVANITELVAVPEPGTVLLVAAGLGFLVLVRRRVRQRA